MTGIFSNINYQQYRLITVLIFCILQCYVVDNVSAQEYSWEEFVEKISEWDNDDSEYLSNLLDDLAELHENPFNLNAASKEDLARLPFLDAETIEEILAYVYRYGPLQSLGELKMIPALDYQIRQFLTLFVYVAPVTEERQRLTMKDLWRDGRHELLTRLDIPLYKRDGYKRPADEVLLKNPNKIYLGNSLYNNVRYQYRYGNRMVFGVLAEKDAGEPFGSYGCRPYDFYSFHFLLKDCGKLKTWVLGDYRLGFGEGLVVNTDFSLGKSTMLNVSDRPTHIRRAFSTSETSFFRGTAAMFGFGAFECSAFYSYLPTDATLRKDGTISTLKTDGMHRTLLELSKRHNVKEQSVGFDFTWSGKGLKLGLTGLYEHFNIPFSTGTELYRRYYPSGKDFVNVGAHYRYRFYKFLFSGETAFSQVHGGWATLNRMSYRFNHRYSLLLLQRLFTYQYVGLRANTFSENSSVSNESGFYMGLEAAPVNGLNISAYVDYFYFPWYKFQTDHTSDGVECQVQTDWNPYGSRWNVSGRYQFKKKERNGEPYIYNKVRLQVQYAPNACFNLRVLGRYTNIRDQYARHTHGYMAGSVIRWQERKERVRLSLSGAYFHSRDYKAPMSFYEPSLLYAFSFLNLQGEGMRLACNIRLDVVRHLTVIAKYGVTRYFDRDEIGSGLQRIEGRMKNDVSLQLRCAF